MENKLVKVKEKKVEKVVEFYNSFGWELLGEPEKVKEGSNLVVLKFERDKEKLGKSYRTVIRGEKLYRQIARPYPLAFCISFGIGAVLLALYFVLQKSFQYYIVFLYFGLMFLCVSVYLLSIFLIIFAKRHALLKRVVKNVGIDAGTIKEYPLPCNIKPETDKTWLIDENQ